MSKKTFFVIVLLMIIAGFAGWYFFIRPEATNTTNPGSQTDSQNIFPFGKNPTPPKNDPKPVTTESNSTSTIITDNSKPPQLRQLHKDPTAGASFKVSSTTTDVRYVDRATGHIYESNVGKNGEIKISGVTIPKVYEALFNTTGDKLILRYTQEEDQSVRSFYASISTSSKPENALEGLFLADGIKDITVIGNKIFYINRNPDGSQLFQADINGEKKVSVFSSTFTDWSFSINNPQKAFLYTKPSGLAQGFGYILNTEKGTTEKITGGFPGLTGNISPFGDFIFLSAAENGSIGSGLYTISSSSVSALPVKTLSDKCVWSSLEKEVVYCAVPASVPQGIYPDDWYKGIVSFSDLLWKINVKTGETDLILNATKGNSFDMTNLRLSRDDKYLTFINKKDQSLWLYRIKE